MNRGLAASPPRSGPRRVAFAAAAAALAACGDTEIAPSGYDRALGETLCAKVHECEDTYPGDDPFEFSRTFGGSEESCVRGLVIDPDRAAEIDAAIERGTLHFNPANARLCLDEIAAIPCDEVWTAAVPVACLEVFTGTVPLGGACVLDEECARPGEYCEGICLVPGSGYAASLPSSRP